MASLALPQFALHRTNRTLPLPTLVHFHKPWFMCLQKWKQLSRLQRSLILFFLAVTLVLALLSYSRMSKSRTGKCSYPEMSTGTHDSRPLFIFWGSSKKEDWLETNDDRLKSEFLHGKVQPVVGPNSMTDKGPDLPIFQSPPINVRNISLSMYAHVFLSLYIV